MIVVVIICILAWTVAKLKDEIVVHQENISFQEKSPFLLIISFNAIIFLPYLCKRIYQKLWRDRVYDMYLRIFTELD